MTLRLRSRETQMLVAILAIAVAVLSICSWPAVAQEQVTSPAEVTPWTHPGYVHDANEFQFAIVSDRAANPREGVFAAGVEKLQLLRPEFVLSIGDFIHGYGEGMKPLTDEAVVREKRQKFDELLKPLSVPFYRVTGNHDLNNELSARIWKELYGPTYYSFTYKGALFLCLNSQDGKNYKTGMGEDQIAWVKKTLAEQSDARWVFLFFHQPLWLEDEKRLQAAQGEDGAPKLTGFDQIEKLLEDRDYTVFAGHHHRYGKWIKNGKKYFRLATTGGQSALGGPDAGQFDHVMWVTMTSEGPVLCNLLLEGILDEDAKVNLPAAPAPQE